MFRLHHGGCGGLRGFLRGLACRKFRQRLAARSFASASTVSAGEPHDIRPLAMGAAHQITAAMGWSLPYTLGVLARLHQLRGLGDAKVLKSLGHGPKGRHYRG